MQTTSQSYSMTVNGETYRDSNQRFDTIADVLDYAEGTGLAEGTEAVITGTSWPGLVIRVSRI